MVHVGQSIEVRVIYPIWGNEHIQQVRVKPFCDNFFSHWLIMINTICAEFGSPNIERDPELEIKTQANEWL